MANAMGSLPTAPTSDANPRHEVRDTLRSVDLPTDKSPFGPMRKQRDSEPKPVRIPGQRQDPDTPRPRPTPPKQQLTARPLGRDINYATGDRYERHASWDAFGADFPGSAA